MEQRVLLTGLFAGRQFDVGSAPGSLLTGDFNNDGRLDLAGTTGAAVVTILFNDTNHTLRRRSGGIIYAGPETRPSDVACADFNSDGIADFATANYGMEDVSVMLGQPDGTYATAARYSAGRYPDAIAAGDFNGDGKPDLAVGNQQSGAGLSILLNNGNGTFAAATNIVLPGATFDVAVSDVNHDGKLDLLASVSFISHNVAVLLGTGSGTFSTPALYTTGAGTRGIAIADLNGDGSPDFAAALNTQAGVSIRLNNGNGTFGAETAIPIGAPAYAIMAADLDADGSPDLAVSTLTGGGLVTLRGTGQGGFESPRVYAAGGGGLVVAALDINDDGRLDVAVGADSGSVAILLNNGDGTLDAPQVLADGFNAEAITHADFDGDGDLDLAEVNYLGVGLSVLMNDGQGTFTPAASQPSIAAEPTSLAAGDFNDDGITDLAVSHYLAVGGVSILIGLGNGAFQTPVFITVQSRLIDLKIGDVNGDGREDIVTANWDNYSVAVLLGRTGGTFDPPVISPSGSAGSLVLLDVDKDGYLDVAVASGIQDGKVNVLRGQGTAGFLSPSSHTVGQYPLDVTGGDFNLDGWTDLAAPTYSGGIAVMLNRRDGTFASPLYLAAGLYPQAIESADFNMDGRPDLAVANQSDNVSILLGNGDGTFATSFNHSLGEAADDLTLADFNSDGRVDFAAISSRYEQTSPIYVSLNRSASLRAPMLVSTGFDVNTRQVVFVLDAPIHAGSVQAADLVVTHLGTGASSRSATAASVSTDGRTLRFTLPVATPDGNYAFAVPALSIFDTAGAPTRTQLDASTFILAGDLDRDRDVDFSDLLVLAQNFGRTGRTYSQGNVNYSTDTKVDFADLLALSKRYGVTLFVNRMKPTAKTANTLLMGELR